MAKKYNVRVTISGSYDYDVEAESAKEAKEKAKKLAYDEYDSEGLEYVDYSEAIISIN